MLRRYLIVNGVATILLYAAISAWMPSVSGLSGGLRRSIDLYAMDNPVLGPIFYRLVTVGRD